MAEPTHAERARTLVHAHSTGALSTIATDPSGYPFGSHVLYAMHEGAPVLVISTLAEHTKNVAVDPRVSLLVVEAARGEGNALALGRVTLVGRLGLAADRERAVAAYVEAHPSARPYADFHDFAPYVLAVEHVRYVGGFGRMSWVDGPAWMAASADPLSSAREGICAHMNADHADACVAYARFFGGMADASSAVMTGIDRYGFDLVVDGSRSVRVPFESDVTDARKARTVLVAMVREASSALK